MCMNTESSKEKQNKAYLHNSYDFALRKQNKYETVTDMQTIKTSLLTRGHADISKQLLWSSK